MYALPVRKCSRGIYVRRVPLRGTCLGSPGQNVKHFYPKARGPHSLGHLSCSHILFCTFVSHRFQNFFLVAQDEKIGEFVHLKFLSH
jgi:hypothetical protein